MSRGGWKDAYDAQMGTWRWERSKLGREWRYDHYNMSAAPLNADTRSLLASMYEVEDMKLLNADPYYVSAEMSQVVAAACESFAPEPLLPTDLLTDIGFCYFAEPIPMPDKYEVMIALHAFSWAPICATNDSEYEQFLAHAETGEPMEKGSIGVIYGEPGARQVGVALTLYSQAKTERWEPEWGPIPPVVPMHLTPWYFGMGFEGNEIDEEGARTGVERWWQAIQTCLRLMQQRIGHRFHERPDRPMRREAKRYGFHEREVVVVRLRREYADHVRHEPESAANYSHRFIVSGHWRWQPYGDGIRRQIWISPFVKGDPSLPLVVRPRRVFNLDR